MAEAGDIKQEPVMKASLMKIAIGTVIVLAVLGYLVWRIAVSVSVGTSSRFEIVLSDYYRHLAGGRVSEAARLTAGGFRNEIADVKVHSGRYELFSYDFQRIVSTNAPAPAGRLTYSLYVSDNNRRDSWLLEADFIDTDGAAKIAAIRRLYEGRNITRK
jgi:hypothetical protein